ncbi:general secretion pathway protein C [Tamilnaduibacter salinus]|uniref:General secretion pathway protein C n=1 Tax=Tamilnaduibacter salinus TaxID=1484056 RepID=A0A2A2I2S3_9GAMM|nr:type II secretion system protein N [Tamilnaduibacter salinus]PAV25616.1 general secretion pathway protein GspC [Tamilnaduibacter salinus]PVY78101.1 general secretion pathway protein C [Tamilnaduibacter salinus]
MNEWTQRLPWLLTALLTAGMLASLGWQGWAFMQLRSEAAIGSEPDAGGQPLKAETGQAELPPLTSVNLFGKAGDNSDPEPVETDDLPETNLRLTLRGAMAGDEKAPASALVEDSRGQTEAYTLGDTLPGEATLRAIHPRRIVIERRGQLETLTFPQEDEQGASVQTASRTTPTTPSASQSRTNAQRRSDPRREQVRQRLEELRERLRQNSN